MSLEDELIDLKVNLNLKGQNLITTWTELTSLLDTYRAKLAVKETLAKVRYENKTQDDVDKLREEMCQLKAALTKTQLQVTVKDNLICRLRIDLARLQSKLIETQQKLHVDSELRSDVELISDPSERNASPNPIARIIKVEGGEERCETDETGPQFESWEIRDAETASLVLQSEDGPHLTPSPTPAATSHKRKQSQPQNCKDLLYKVIKTEQGDMNQESRVPIVESNANASLFMGEQQESSHGSSHEPNPGPTTPMKTNTAFYSAAVGDGVIPAQGTNLVVHAREQIPATEKILRPRRRCHLCYSLGKRKDTRYYCPACPRQPAFCNEPCFEIYHSKLQKVTIPKGESVTSVIKREFILKGDIDSLIDSASDIQTGEKPDNCDSEMQCTLE